MSATTDPVANVWRVLRRSADRAGCVVALADAAARPWWSATFGGDRLHLSISAAPPGPARAWLATLPDADLPLAGRFVADCVVDLRPSGDDALAATLTLLVLDAR